MPEGPRGAWKPSTQRGAIAAALLDTHIWVWYLDGVSDRMAPGAIDLLRRIGQRGQLVVSEMTVWELANKASKGRISLAPSADEWIERAAALPGFRFVMPDRAMLLLSTRLPNLRTTDLTDPVDRMLLATAMREQLPLITVDGSMIAYARRTRHLSVCDARP
jgi:PIN domain nuclease of toxin-antitoxin system